MTGAAVQWLRDQLGLIDSAAAIEDLARTVEDNGDVYFVPAFSGLFAPHWREDARGVIVGLTAYARAGHLARPSWRRPPGRRAKCSMPPGPSPRSPSPSCAWTAG